MKTNNALMIIGVIILIVIIVLVAKPKDDKMIQTNDDGTSIDLPLGTGGPDDVVNPTTAVPTNTTPSPTFPTTGVSPE